MRRIEGATQGATNLHGPHVRYTLMVKTLEGSAPAPRQGAPNPAMQRQGSVPLDTGRPWAGDLYDEGPVTDPEEAYAKFAGGEDVEAWLDRGDDATLIGWVSDGNDIYRYADPESWAMDVDGAGMTRTDIPTAVGEPTSDDAEGDGVGGDDIATESDVEESLFDEDPDTNDDTSNAADAPTAGEAFDEEPDAATTDTDPTDALVDPTDLPADDDTAADVNPFDGMSDDDALEDPVPDTTEDDADGVEGTKKKKNTGLFGNGGVQTKHMPGEHNQESHGDWSDGITPDLDAARPAGGLTNSGSPTSSAPRGGPPAPKAGKAGTGRARLDNESLARLSDEDLEAIMGSDDFYDRDTMFAAATELDARDDLNESMGGRVGDAKAGSPGEAAAIDSVIPAAWAAWAGEGAKGRKGAETRKDSIDELWDQQWRSLMAAAEIRFGNSFLKPKYQEGYLAKVHLTVDDLFNGRMTRAQVNKYGSEELLRYFAEPGVPHMSRDAFMAEFYESYARRQRQLGSSYFSEHG